jgi:hypothetical protein
MKNSESEESLAVGCTRFCVRRRTGRGEETRVATLPKISGRVLTLSGCARKTETRAGTGMRKGDSAHVFQRNQVDPRLIDVRAGEYVPLEDAAERDLEQPLIKAVERRQSKRMALYQRPQLYKFAPGATREAAARYLEDLRLYAMQASRNGDE